MAEKTVYVSDLSGKAIAEGSGAKIRVTFEDARRGVYDIDATAGEPEEFVQKGTKVARRGRKPRGVS